jgi:hypothetical protein
MILTDAIKEAGVTYDVAIGRLRMGWPLDRALRAEMVRRAKAE